MGKGDQKNRKLAKKTADDFDSYEAWEKDFRTSGRFINFWINEHDVFHPSGCSPMLIMDVFEACLHDRLWPEEGINWSVVEERLKYNRKEVKHGND